MSFHNALEFQIMVAWRGESVAIRRMLCFVILLFGGAPALLPAKDPIVAAPDIPVAPAVPATRPEVTAAMEHLEPLWENMDTDVVSCEAKFRVYFQGSSRKFVAGISGTEENGG